jgi:hypothetical protein
MNDMKPYFRGIEMYNDALIVRVMLPPKWKAYNSNDGRIKATPSETVANEYFYYANSNDTTYEDIFDLIEETIKANNDIVLKLKLLRDKVEELKEMFSNHSYDELTTLKFVFEAPKNEKPKRKYTRKKKEVEKAQEEPQTENNEVTEEDNG